MHAPAPCAPNRGTLFYVVVDTTLANGLLLSVLLSFLSFSKFIFLSAIVPSLSSFLCVCI